MWCVCSDLVTEMAGSYNQERRRQDGVKLVGLVKNCFVKHWDHLDEKQKDQVLY